MSSLATQARICLTSTMQRSDDSTGCVFTTYTPQCFNHVGSHLHLDTTTHINRVFPKWRGGSPRQPRRSGSRHPCSSGRSDWNPMFWLAVRWKEFLWLMWQMPKSSAPTSPVRLFHASTSWAFTGTKVYCKKKNVNTTRGKLAVQKRMFQLQQNI